MIDEHKIRAAMDNARKHGFKIARDETINELDRCCCALGALAVKTDGSIDEDLFDLDDMGKLVGMTPGEVTSFVSGFDGDSTDQTGERPAAHLLGKLLASEYVE